jgi:exopolysaccharide biosynthesis polyprenyl glycosylphosphotransferase
LVPIERRRFPDPSSCINISNDPFSASLLDKLLNDYFPMTNFRRKLLIKAFMLFDVGILAVSYVVAAVRTWHLIAFSSFASFISMRVKVLNIILFLGLFYSWHAIFSAFGLYRSRRLRDRKPEALDVLKATSVAVIVLGLAAAIFRVRMVTPAFIVLFGATSSLILILCRLLMREVLAWVRRHGRNLSHVLIVGTNQRALEYARTIDERPELGYHLIGFADQEWAENREFGKSGKSIVTGLDHFSDFLRERVVDEVVIALPLRSFYSQAANILAECQEQGVIVRVVNRIFDLKQGRVNSGELDFAHVATYSAGLFEGWPLVLKRLLDITGSSILLILLSPILLIVAILVKFDSPGPVFFIQKRVGLNKRKLRMYKFRTMVANAEAMQTELESLNESDGAVFKIRNDPRITRLGKFLRKASIDELPQLLNVLQGDMSLVGPRPLPIRDYQGFDQDWMRRRFSVRPGITCLWQINGRSSVSFQEWMKLDMRYIDSWSFWLDLKILARTIPAVFRGLGAV